MISDKTNSDEMMLTTIIKMVGPSWKVAYYSSHILIILSSKAFEVRKRFVHILSIIYLFDIVGFNI